MMKVKFGDKLKVDSCLVRRSCMRMNKKGRGYSTRYKEWQSNKLFNGEIEVIFLGARTLSNGFTYWDGLFGYIFSPEEYFQAWLVCAKNRNPFYIMPISED